MASKTVDDIFFISSFVITALILIISLNWISVFYVLRRMDVIKKRYPEYLFIAGILTCLSFLDRLHMFLVISDRIPLYPSFFIIGYMNYYLLIAFSQYLLVSRCVLFTVKINFTKALEDQSWVSAIDSKHQNWYIKHKKDIKGRKVIIFNIIIWSLFFIPTMVYMLLNDGESTTLPRVLLAFCGIIACILLLIIRFNIPQYDDTWNLRNETIYMCYGNTISVIFYFVVALALDAEIYEPEYYLFLLVGNMLPFLWMIVLFGYTIYKFELPWNVLSALYYRERLKCVYNPVHSATKSMSPIYDEESKPKNGVDHLAIALANPDTFVLFARHLSREFQIEMLLFTLEATQYIEYLSSLFIDELSNKSHRSVVTNLLKITFPDNIPKSQIITNDDLDYFEKCYEIFSKYIMRGSYLCLNISYRIRNKIYSNFGDKHHKQEMISYLKQNCTNKDLVYIFDDALTEVYHFMKVPFDRFQSQTDANTPSA